MAFPADRRSRSRTRDQHKEARFPVLGDVSLLLHPASDTTRHGNLSHSNLLASNERGWLSHFFLDLVAGIVSSLDDVVEANAGIEAAVVSAVSPLIAVTAVEARLTPTHITSTKKPKTQKISRCVQDSSRE